MATAICLQCGAPCRWSARRGTRLADQRCACGGALRQASFEDGRWVALDTASTVKGQRYQRCGVCQHNRLHLRRAVIPFRREYFGDTFPPDTLVCRQHYSGLLPADHVYWSLLDAPITPTLLAGWIREVEAWIAQGRPPTETEASWEWQQSVPEWLRGELARAADTDLESIRNTLLDHVLRARGASIQPADRERVFGARI
jgi:hypothetical protein